LKGLRRCRKAARERLGLQSFLHLAVRPRIRSAFVEESDSDHANIARIGVFLMRVRLPHGPETKSGHRVGALAKSFDDELPVRIDDIAPLSKRRRTAIENRSEIPR
jgi:hypothetical protein